MLACQGKESILKCTTEEDLHNSNESHKGLALTILQVSCRTDRASSSDLQLSLQKLDSLSVPAGRVCAVSMRVSAILTKLLPASAACCSQAEDC